MRVRRLSGEKKIIQVDSRWSSQDIPVRCAPIYKKSKPMRAGWQWRYAKAVSLSGQKYILLAECNPGRDNWKSMLMIETNDGHSVVARFEHHGSHPGLHAHAHCDRGGIETGASGIDNLARIPPAGAMHRRANAWTERAFWEAAKRFFHVEEVKGPLI